MWAAERGSCYGELLRYHYDVERRSCVSFIYSGCGANENHFVTAEECERACGEYRHQRVCALPPDTGQCVDGTGSAHPSILTTKWYYDWRRAECYMFMWSSCGGNGNRFSSQAECRQLCDAETRPAIGVLGINIIHFCCCYTLCEVTRKVPILVIVFNR